PPRRWQAAGRLRGAGPARELALHAPVAPGGQTAQRSGPQRGARAGLPGPGPPGLGGTQVRYQGLLSGGQGAAARPTAAPVMPCRSSAWATNPDALACSTKAARNFVPASLPLAMPMA